MKSKVIIWIVGILLVCVLAVLVFHLYLLKSGRGIQIHIGSFNIIRLGSPSAFFPTQFEQSFVPFGSLASSVRKPKYERNTTYQDDIPDGILAKDMESGKVDKFSWNDQTHYMCLAPVDYQVPGLDQPVDPAKALKNYTFLNTGNTIGGTSAADIGYYMFKRDVEKGTPVKFILQNETINSDGGLDILMVLVFTTHTKCVRPTEVTSDLPAL